MKLLLRSFWLLQLLFLVLFFASLDCPQYLLILFSPFCSCTLRQREPERDRDRFKTRISSQVVQTVKFHVTVLFDFMAGAL